MNKKQLYESIMKNVAKEVKRAIQEEKETKSDEQKAEEAKLSQEEKVDLWIEGKRNINLELCGADKLRKYYKICQDKDFTKGITDIEKVAKSRNIKLNEGYNMTPVVVELNNCKARVYARKGFMMYDPQTESVTVYQYDNIEDLEELGIDISEDFYKELDMLKIGRTAIDYLTNAIHTRIK